MFNVLATNLLEDCVDRRETLRTKADPPGAANHARL